MNDDPLTGFFTSRSLLSLTFRGGYVTHMHCILFDLNNWKYAEHFQIWPSYIFSLWLVRFYYLHWALFFSVVHDRPAVHQSRASDPEVLLHKRVTDLNDRSARSSKVRRALILTNRMSPAQVSCQSSEDSGVGLLFYLGVQGCSENAGAKIVFHRNTFHQPKRDTHLLEHIDQQGLFFPRRHHLFYYIPSLMRALLSAAVCHSCPTIQYGCMVVQVLAGRQMKELFFIFLQLMLKKTFLIFIILG